MLRLVNICLQLITSAIIPSHGQEQMDKDTRKAFTDLLRKMSKKGFYETLEFICERESMHYAEILKHNLDDRIVRSRATVTLILRGLSKMGLIKRTVMDSRPIRTLYQPTEKGLKLLQHLREMEQL